MKRTIGLATIVAAQLWASGALAATIWDGGGANDNWTTDLNWEGDLAPGTGNDVEVQFAGSTRLTPSVDTHDPWTLQKIVFNSGAGAFVIGGNEVSLQGSGELIRNDSSATQTFDNDVQLQGAGWNTIRAASGHIVINGDLDLQTGVYARGARNVTVNGLITGSGTAFSRTDSGILRLTNPNNSFTGTPSIAHGVLEIDNIADGGVNSAIGAGSAIALGQGTWGPVRHGHAALHRPDRLDRPHDPDDQQQRPQPQPRPRRHVLRPADDRGHRPGHDAHLQRRLRLQRLEHAGPVAAARGGHGGD